MAFTLVRNDGRKKLSFGFGGRVVEGTKVTSSRLATSHHGLSHASCVALVSSEHALER